VAVAEGFFTPGELVGPTDEELLYELGRRAEAEGTEVGERMSARWLPALRARRLPKRAAEVSAAELEGLELPDWVTGESAAKRRWEDGVASELGLEPGEAFLDFPVKEAMFQLDVLVERRGVATRLGREGAPGLMDLPRVTGELYGTARVLRLFTFERREVSPSWLVERLRRAGPSPGGRGGDSAHSGAVRRSMTATEGFLHTS